MSRRDLVERLNEADADYTMYWGTGDLYGEAAAEIENLTAALKDATKNAERYERLRNCNNGDPFAVMWADRAMILRYDELDLNVDALKRKRAA